MRRLLPFVLAVIAILWSGLGPSHAERRVALVIGNGAYRSAPALASPGNDAADIAASLQRLGFTVTRLTDSTFDDMRKGVLAFGDEARGADIAIVFFAGHGVEIGGESWLLPIDAELRSDKDAEREAVSLSWVITHVAGASRLGLVILDASRNNPFRAGMQRSPPERAVEAGPARSEPTENVLVAYAARDGTTASDGTGRNSPFTTALLKNIETPGLEIARLFRNVREDVMRVTGRAQQPFVYGSLSGDAIVLKPPAAGQRAGRPVDTTVWNAIKGATEPKWYEDFIKQYPKSRHGAEARRRLQDLRKKRDAN